MMSKKPTARHDKQSDPGADHLQKIADEAAYQQLIEKIKALQTMFPSLHGDQLRRALEDNRGDMPQTIHQLQRLCLQAPTSKCSTC